eukprot:m.2974 g.2974  ORF g.2974 m.2974 type:complete len:398 (+) comp1988_c0_seq1:69-1262(+)
MGRLWTIVGVGVAAASGFVGYYGSIGKREIEGPALIHEQVMKEFMKGDVGKQFHKETHRFDWRVPQRESDAGVMQYGFTHNLFFDLSMDKFTRSSENESDRDAKKRKDGNVKDPTLFITAPSFVSSRTSFLGMATEVFDNFAVTEPPSYGANSQKLRPEHYCDVVFDHALTTQVHLAQVAFETEKISVVAAGHEAINVLRLAQRNPELFDRIILINPTFRGPLPTARFDLEQRGESGKSELLSTLQSVMWEIYKMPYLRDALHHFSSSPENIKKQLMSHVFEDPEYISPNVVSKFVEFSKQGPCVGKCAFLVGKMDFLKSREELADLIKGGVKVPTLVVMGYNSPETSKEDVKPLQDAAKTDKNLTFLTTRGALRSYEEFPHEIANIIKPHFQKESN